MKNKHIVIYPLIAAIMLIACKTFCEVNMTESEPIGIYLLSSAKNIKKGDMVTIQTSINTVTRLANERRYTTRNRLLKTIMGVPGDTISIHDGVVYVNNDPIGKIHAHDSQGKPLPSQLKEGIIPDGEYFLASMRHENSFDSRYFGLISKECIMKKAYPIFTN